MTSADLTRADMTSADLTRADQAGVPLTSLTAEVLGALTLAGLRMVTAESLTVGQVASAVGAVPGASAVLLGGVVAYDTEVKIATLGVPRPLVEEHGVISAHCASAMARGARELLRADLAVATTGVAGPDAQEGHAPGTVFVAVATAHDVWVRALDLTGDRAAIQRATVAAALKLVLAVVRGEEPAVR